MLVLPPLTFSQGLLSGLAHPIVGLDHLAVAIAVGCLAARQARGAWLAIGYLAATMIGAAAHIGEATVAGAEIFVALSVIALGAVLLRTESLRTDIAIALFACTGLVHGYALGEPIAAADAAPRNGYFIGLTLIQSTIVFAAMAGARALAARTAKPTAVRVLGAAVACIGLVLLVREVVSAA
jgi:urease accessory protein